MEPHSSLCTQVRTRDPVSQDILLQRQGCHLTNRYKLCHASFLGATGPHLGESRVQEH